VTACGSLPPRRWLGCLAVHVLWRTFGDVAWSFNHAPCSFVNPDGGHIPTLREQAARNVVWNPMPSASPVPLLDAFGRRAKDLRISITDRCNFRCSYCMPEEGLAWLARSELLSYE